MGRAIDLTGRRFGRLVAIEPTVKRSRGSVVWRCKCDCGNECFVGSSELVTENTKSCGCLRAELAATRLARRKTLVEGTDLACLTQKRSSNNTSGVKGVSFDKRIGKWKAYIRIARKCQSLGYFDTVEEAAQARREAEEELFDPILVAHGLKPTKEEK